MSHFHCHTASITFRCHWFVCSFGNLFFAVFHRWMSLIYNRVASQNGIIETIASEIFRWNRLRWTITESNRFGKTAKMKNAIRRPTIQYESSAKQTEFMCQFENCFFWNHLLRWFFYFPLRRLKLKLLQELKVTINKSIEQNEKKEAKTQLLTRCSQDGKNRVRVVFLSPFFCSLPNFEFVCFNLLVVTSISQHRRRSF